MKTIALAQLKAISLFVGLCVALSGCGSEKLAKVAGTVVHKRMPVTGGTLIFSPMGKTNPGRPASAEINPDGTFVLGTVRTTDGALVGRHRVTFTPPPQQLTEEQRSNPNYIAPPPAYMGLTPKTAEVEIKTGDNNIEIELDWNR